jgi:hypothetical protein
VGRKSREKRERHDQVAEAQRALGLLDEAATPQADVVIVAKAPPRRRKPRAPVGARVARVAVDDAMWAEFRELCGATPASVRLGQLVEADVQNARESTPESEAVAAVRSIRAHADRLEAFVRDQAARAARLDG